MNKRGWPQADLARNSGLDPSLINNYLTGKRNVGINSVVSIAKAFGVRPDAVCRAIGLFPPIPEATAQTEQLLHLFSQLDEADKTTIMRMIEVMLICPSCAATSPKPMMICGKRTRAPVRSITGFKAHRP